ncbi:MAG: protein phosphatase 2C domain-containing protein [Desulfobacter sp.]|nr:MAG: protein phosphatase 2C domain-containing protein [Desulfobacter sp.]
MITVHDKGYSEYYDHQKAKSQIMQSRFLQYICDSIKGRTRTHNKDGIISAYGKNYHILGVLDGVSSAKGALKAVKYSVSYIGKNHSSYAYDESFDLAGLIRDLNQRLLTANLIDPYLTCSLVFIPNQPSQKIKFLNLGDSRIYSISKQYIFQLTADDSDPINKNILTKYLGSKQLINEDINESELPVGSESQNLLICTDGFYSVMESSEYKLRELHRLSNLKHSYYIKKGIKKLIVGSNNDDATYLLARWSHV